MPPSLGTPSPSLAHQKNINQELQAPKAYPSFNQSPPPPKSPLTVTQLGKMPPKKHPPRAAQKSAVRFGGLKLRFVVKSQRIG